MIPFKVALIIVFAILLILLITRKFKGQKGTWDKKSDIQEFALIMSDVQDDKKSKNPKEQTLLNQESIFPQQKFKINKFKNFQNNIGKNFNSKNDSIGEQICRYHLNQRFNKPFLKERPDFLKNPVTNTNLELDCFCRELGLALEYNGRQHYEFTPKFHKSKNDFYNQKYRDQIKKQLCYENKIDLIEVPFSVSHEEIPIYIDQALEKLGRIKLV